jgi:hypothetical protein
VIPSPAFAPTGFTQLDSTLSQRVIQEPSVRVIRGGSDGSLEGGAW